MVISRSRLLKIPEVMNEISRHLWFESEKAGYDVGRDYAEKDWMKKYSKEWVKHNLPNEIKKKTPIVSRMPKAPKSTKEKKRRAKSYTV